MDGECNTIELIELLAFNITLTTLEWINIWFPVYSTSSLDLYKHFQEIFKTHSLREAIVWILCDPTFSVQA